MSKVSRSTYQKLKEENKRLLKDIKLLSSGGFSPERIILIDKWQNHFKKEKEFNSLMKDVAISYMENNPNNPIVKAVKSLGK